MMQLFPAIDLYEGKVVRLVRGDFSQKTIYSEKPAEVARNWESQGGQWLHVVDLEGAKCGELKNLKTLLKIRKATTCKIQFGGGLRKIEALQTIFNEGIDRAVIGTKALDGVFLRRALEQFGSKLAVGLDVRDGVVQTQGWLKGGGQSLQAALTECNNYSLETLIYTDIKKDGMLQGPNLEEFGNVLRWTKSRVILSGGISTLEDLRKCSKIQSPNFEGVIIGKALYQNQFSLKEALETVQRQGGEPHA